MLTVSSLPNQPSTTTSVYNEPKRIDADNRLLNYQFRIDVSDKPRFRRVKMDLNNAINVYNRNTEFFKKYAIIIAMGDYVAQIKEFFIGNMFIGEKYKGLSDERKLELTGGTEPVSHMKKIVSQINGDEPLIILVHKIRLSWYRRHKLLMDFANDRNCGIRLKRNLNID